MERARHNAELESHRSKITLLEDRLSRTVERRERETSDVKQQRDSQALLLEQVESRAQQQLQQSRALHAAELAARDKEHQVTVESMRRLHADELAAVKARFASTESLNKTSLVFSMSS